MKKLSKNEVIALSSKHVIGSHGDEYRFSADRLTAFVNEAIDIAVPAWISVGDKLPAIDASLYLSDGESVIPGGYGRYDHQPMGGEVWEDNCLGFYGYNLGIDGDVGRFNATHWMLHYAPAAPKT